MSGNDCKNCTHSKQDHQLVLDRFGGGDFLPGTNMPSGKLESKIMCTKCSCKDYAPQERLQEKWYDNYIVKIINNFWVITTWRSLSKPN